MPMLPIFDGHNDTVLDLYRRERTAGKRSFFGRGVQKPEGADAAGVRQPVTAGPGRGQPEGAGHLDLPRAREGGFAGGFFALFVPPLEPAGLPSSTETVVEASAFPSGALLVEKEAAPTRPKNAYFPSLEHRYAVHFTERLVERLFALEEESDGALRVVRSISEIDECREAGRVAAILHFEGAEAIDPELRSLSRWYERGLRSIGITWSRENAFGHGVPFVYPSSPDTGPGLKEAGVRLVRRCNDQGILLDLAHLNERGFWDVADRSERPLVVTHAAAHALCPASRNLTDAQLDAVAASGGVVGVVFAVAFLREDGCEDEDTPLERIADHVVHMVRRMGSRHVALGSDFDGARIPRPLGDASGLPRLIRVLRERGLSDSQLQDIAWRSWARVIDESWR